MNNHNSFSKSLNRRGYTTMLIFILLSMIIFWRMMFSTSEAATFIRFQKNAMSSSHISLEK